LAGASILAVAQPSFGFLFGRELVPLGRTFGFGLAWLFPTERQFEPADLSANGIAGKFVV
jgi:hypothetical protein